MEVAVIDWKNLDSRFVKDDILEQFNAPQWVDFSAADDFVDDEAWFCRPGNPPSFLGSVLCLHRRAASLTSVSVAQIAIIPRLLRISVNLQQPQPQRF